MQPFTIVFNATNAALINLHSRFSGWLAGLSDPARFVCVQIPANLNEKIAQVNLAAQETHNAQRAQLCMEYRRYYEMLQDHSEYQRSVCGMVLWSHQVPHAPATSMGSAFGTRVEEHGLPPL